MATTRPHWLQPFALTLIAIILVSSALSLLSSARAAALTNKILPDFAVLRPWPTRAVLSFSTAIGQQLTLHTTDAASTCPQNLAIAGWAPDWADDGSKVAFLADVAGTAQLHVLVTGHNFPLQLTTSQEAKSTPAWSPNGSRIAFLVDPTPPAANRAPTREQPAGGLWVIDADGEQERLLAENCVTFAWSPDGQQLAYVTGDGRQEARNNAQQTPPLYYLWTIAPGSPPTLIAKVNSPAIAWKRRP